MLYIYVSSICINTCVVCVAALNMVKRIVEEPEQSARNRLVLGAFAQIIFIIVYTADISMLRRIEHGHLCRVDRAPISARPTSDEHQKKTAPSRQGYECSSAHVSHKYVLDSINVGPVIVVLSRSGPEWQQVIWFGALAFVCLPCRGRLLTHVYATRVRPP